VTEVDPSLRRRMAIMVRHGYVRSYILNEINTIVI
jgi:hypothetical protein